MAVVKAIFIFVVAGLCEIGGGYLIWLWLKQGKPFWMALVGAFILVMYGVVATLQTSNFAKVYATYGAIFVVLSLVWAYFFDKYIPNRYDIIGGTVILIGAAIIYYGPR